MKPLFKFHTRIYPLILTLSLLLLPQVGESQEVNSQQFEPVVITIADEIEVAQKTVRLADIAVFEGDNEEYIKTLEKIIVGRTSKLGKALSVTRNVVVSRINHISRPDQRAFLNMPDSITIKVSANKIEANEIVERVHEFLQQEYAQGDSELNVIKVDVTKDIYVPKEEEVKFLFNVQRRSSGSKIIVKMDISGSNGYQLSQRIPVHINLVEETVVATRNISPREIIGREDVKLAFINVSDIRRKPVKDLDEVIGKAATTRISMNAPLTEGSVKNVPIITRGDSITIVADGGAFRITVPGVAKQNGFQDQMIRVENINSQKKIFGKVIDSKTVLIQF